MSEPILSDDGFWKLDEGEWVPTEKQLLSIENGTIPHDTVVMEQVLAFPPLGNNQPNNKSIFVVELFAVTSFSLLLWSLFRFFTSDILESIDTIKFNLAYILVAPIIWLVPMMLYWAYYRKEDGLPVRFFVFNSLKDSLNKRFIVLMTSIGLSITLVEILIVLFRDLIIFYSGIYGDVEIEFMWGTATDSIFLYLVVLVTNLFFVATVEEIFFRGFLQDQLSRVLTVSQSVLISGTIFGLTHLPIAIFIYELEGLQLTLAVINWIGMGLAFGYVYHITRNIWVCIFWHGIYNATVSTINWGFYVSDIPSKDTEQFIWVLSQLLLHIGFLLLIYFTRSTLGNFGRYRTDF